MTCEWRSLSLQLTHRTSRTSGRRLRRAHSRSQLHEHHVEPAVELVADLGEAGDFAEAVLGVEGEAGGLLGVDAGDDGVQAERAGALDLVGEDRRADALAVAVGVDVDGVLDGEAVAALAAKRVERAVADDDCCRAVAHGDGDGVDRLAALRTTGGAPRAVIGSSSYVVVETAT